MARTVTVQPGYANVQLPDRGVYSAGQTVTLTEEEYAALAPGVVGTVVTDDGFSGDVVTDQGATVAPLGQTISATYAPAEVQAISDKVDEMVGALSGPNKALASA